MPVFASLHVRLSQLKPAQLGAAAAPLLAASALVLGFEVANWDRVTPGVVALGAPLGGLNRDEAAARLEARAQMLLKRPIHVAGPDHAWDFSARDLGLRLPVSDTVEAAYAVGRDGNPIQRLAVQASAAVRGHDASFTNGVDRPALESSVRRMAAAIDRPMVDAGVDVDAEGTVTVTPAQTGRKVDVTASAERIARAIATETPAVDLVVSTMPPTITDAMAEPARHEVERILGKPGDPPIVLTFEDQRLPLTRSDIAPLLTVRQPAAGHPLEVTIDPDAANALASLLAAELHRDTVDARFDWNGGDLRVLRTSRAGRDLDKALTAHVLSSALLAGTRTVALPVSTVEPSVSSEHPRALGIVELIDRGSTSFAGSIPEKKHNIRLAAEHLNGVVVPPHGTFSFNKEIGPTTLEAGFSWGFAIESGADGPKTVPSVAGGICQVATTLFQPVFWAGYPLEERYSHAYWIPAYTSRGVVGLDVTVDGDADLDFKWSNPTDDYVLIQAHTSGDTVEFALYGKKPAWTVEVEPARMSNQRPTDPSPIQQEDPSMARGHSLQVETARDGFDVEVTRVVTPLVGEPRVLHLRTSYQPSRNVTLVGTADQAAQ